MAQPPRQNRTLSFVLGYVLVFIIDFMSRLQSFIYSVDEIFVYIYSGNLSHRPMSVLRGQVLTADQAIEIYKHKLCCLDKSKVNGSNKNSSRGSSTPLAKKYGVSPKAIRDIWNRRSWAFATVVLWKEEDPEMLEIEPVNESAVTVGDVKRIDFLKISHNFSNRVQPVEFLRWVILTSKLAGKRRGDSSMPRAATRLSRQEAPRPPRRSTKSRHQKQICHTRASIAADAEHSFEYFHDIAGSASSIFHSVRRPVHDSMGSSRTARGGDRVALHRTRRLRRVLSVAGGLP